ncbi:MAG: hypothetical protein JXA25_12460 [Anaerolineales bacterium]|nr:hypothetical protein [Anaerolineales bacterium]
MRRLNHLGWMLVVVFIMAAMISCSVFSGAARDAAEEAQSAEEPTDQPVSTGETAAVEPTEEEVVVELDLCTLLTDEQVSSVLGSPVESSGAMGVANCTYTTTGDVMASLSVSAAQGEEAKALTVLGLQLMTMFGAPEEIMEDMTVLMESLPTLTVWEVVQGTFEILEEIGYQIEPAEDLGSTALWGSSPDVTTLVIVEDDTYLSLNLTGMEEEQGRQMMAELALSALDSLPARFTVPMSGQFSLDSSDGEGEGVLPDEAESAGGPAVWVANSGSDTLVGVDPVSLEILGRVIVNQHPYDLAGYENELYVTSRVDGTVLYVDRNSLEIGAVFDTEATDLVGVDVDQDYVYVSNCSAGKIIILQRRTMKPVETIPVNLCWDAVVGLDSVWVPAGDASLMQYDAETYEEIRQIDVGSGPALMALSEEHLWVGCVNDRTVHKVDPVIHRTVKVIRLNIEGSLYDLTAGEGFIWAAVSDGILRIDPDRGEVLGVFELPFTPSRIRAGLGSLWVTNVSGGTLHRIDPLSGEETGSVFVGDSPMALIISP